MGARIFLNCENILKLKCNRNVMYRTWAFDVYWCNYSTSNSKDCTSAKSRMANGNVDGWCPGKLAPDTLFGSLSQPFLLARKGLENPATHASCFAGGSAPSKASFSLALPVELERVNNHSMPILCSTSAVVYLSPGVSCNACCLNRAPIPCIRC